MHVYERTYGKIERMFRLPDNAEDEKIEASMKNGVLTVHIPKAPEEAKEEIPESGVHACPCACGPGRGARLAANARRDGRRPARTGVLRAAAGQASLRRRMAFIIAFIHFAVGRASTRGLHAATDDFAAHVYLALQEGGPRLAAACVRLSGATTSGITAAAAQPPNDEARAMGGSHAAAHASHRLACASAWLTFFSTSDSHCM